MKITNLKRTIDIIKGDILNEVQTFSKFVHESKSQIFGIVNTINSNVYSRTESISLTLDSHKQALKEREHLISDLQLKVSELTEQLNTLNGSKINGARVLQLETELDDKNRYINDMEYNLKTQIDELKIKLAEKTKQLNQFKDDRYQTIQFQAQIDEKERIINETKRKYKEKINVLKAEMNNQEKVITFLNPLQDEIESMKKSLENKDKEISQLKDDIQSSQSVSIQFEQSKDENSVLKNTLKLHKKKLLLLSKNYKQLQGLFDKSEDTIKNLKNEVSTLKAEKSMNTMLQNSSFTSGLLCSGSPARNAAIKKKTEQEEEEENNKAFSLAMKIKELTLSIEDEKEKNRRTTELLEALKINLSEVENENNQLKEKASIANSLYSRKESRIEKLKLEILDLNNKLRQKEDFINQLLASENERSIEIERLQTEIDKMLSDNLTQRMNENSKNMESQSITIEKSEYDQLHSSVNNYKKKTYDDEIHIKELNIRIKELEIELKAIQRASQDRENEIFKYNRESFNLDNYKNKFDQQMQIYIDKTEKQIRDLENQLRQTTEENTDYCNKYKAAMENMSNYASIIDDLRIENNHLKQENINLSSNTSFEVIPLQNENIKLKAQIDQLKEKNNKYVEESRSLIIENAQLKAHTQHIENSKVNQNIIHIEELEEKLNESEEKLSHLLDFIGVKSIDEFTNKWKDYIVNIEKQKLDLSKHEEQIEKLKIEIEKQQEQIKKEKERNQTPNQEEKIQFAQNKELELVKQKLEEITREKETKDKQILDLENEKSDISKELAATKLQYEELKIDVDSLHSLVRFDTMQDLKESIVSLLSEKAKCQTSIMDSQAAVRKSKAQLEENNKKFEAQQKIIDKLNNTVKELRDENLSSYTKLNHTIYELRNELQNSEEQNEIISSELKNLHDILDFNSPEDLYFAVQQEIHKKDQVIDELKFKFSQAQNSIQSKNSEYDALKKVLNDKKEEVKELKVERNQLRNDKIKLVNTLNNTKPIQDLHNTKLNEIASAIKAKDINQIIPTINSMKIDLEEKDSQIVGLNEHIESLNLQLVSIQNLMEKNIEENRQLENGSKKQINEILSKLGIDSPESISRIKAKIEESKQMIEDLKKENKQYLNIISKKNDKIASVEDENQKLTSQLSILTDKVDKNDAQLKDMNDTVLNLRIQNDNLQHQKESLEALAHVENNRKEMQNIETEQLRTQLQNVENELNKLNAQKMTIELENNQIKLQNKEQYSKFVQELDDIKQQNIELNQKLLKLTEEKEQIEKKYDISKEQNDLLTNNYNKLKQENDNKENQNVLLKKEKKELKLKFADLTNNLENERISNEKAIKMMKKHSEKELASFAQAKNELNKNNEQLQSQISVLTQNAQEEKEEFLARIDMITEQNDILNDEISALKKEKIEIESEIQGALSQNHNLEEENERILNELEETRRESEEKVEEIDSKVKEANIENEKLMEEINRLKESNKIQVGELSAELSHLKFLEKSHLSKIHLFKNKNNSISSELKLVRQHSSAQLSDLKEELENTRSQNSELITLREELLLKEQENNELAESLQNQLVQLSEESKEIVILKTENDEFRNEIEKLTEKSKQIDKIKSHLASILKTDNVDEAIEEIEKLYKENQKLSDILGTDNIVKSVESLMKEEKLLEKQNKANEEMMTKIADELESNDVIGKISEINNLLQHDEEIKHQLAKFMKIDEHNENYEDNIIKEIKDSYIIKDKLSSIFGNDNLVENVINMKKEADKNNEINKKLKELLNTDDIVTTITEIQKKDIENEELKSKINEEFGSAFSSPKDFIEAVQTINQKSKDHEELKKKINEELGSTFSTPEDIIEAMKILNQKAKEDDELTKIIKEEFGPTSDILKTITDKIKQAKEDELLKENIMKQLSSSSDPTDIINSISCMKQKIHDDEQLKVQIVKELGTFDDEILNSIKELNKKVKNDEILKGKIRNELGFTGDDLLTNIKELKEKINKDDEFKEKILEKLGLSPESLKDKNGNIMDINSVINSIESIQQRAQNNEEALNTVKKMLDTDDVIAKIQELNEKTSKAVLENDQCRDTITKVSKVLLGMDVSLPMSDDVINQLNHSLKEVRKEHEMAATIIEFAQNNGSKSSSIIDSFNFIKDMLEKNQALAEEMVRKMETMKDDLTQQLAVSTRAVKEKYRKAQAKIADLKNMNETLEKLKSELINYASKDPAVDKIFLVSQLTYDESSKLKLQSI